MDITLPDKLILGKNGSIDFCIDIVSDCDSEVIVDFCCFKDIDVKCVNCYRTSKYGDDEVHKISLKANTPKTVWCYARAMNELSVGEYSGKIKILCDDEVVFDDTIRITVKDIKTVGRLHYLNSKIGLDDKIVAPFVPVARVENRVKVLGREYILNDIGLPKRIISYFNQDIKITDARTDVLSDEICFCTGHENFRKISEETDNQNTFCLQKNVCESENFILKITAKFEYDGYAEYKLNLIAKKDITADIHLDIPITEYCRKYFMGLSKQGGFFDGTLDFKWNNEFNQDCFWVGNVNAGAKFLFKSDNYQRPLVNIYYSMSPLNLPTSWDNNGRGGIRYSDGVFTAYSGNMSFKANDEVSFDFDILATPIKEIDLSKQMNTRILHKGTKVENRIEEADKNGANIINIHHGNDLNPFINYPFIETEAVKDFAYKAHKKDILVKLYYTIRELSIYSKEFNAFRDLDYEIFKKNSNIDKELLWQGEMKEWMIKNVGGDVIPAWRENLKGDKYSDSFDAAVITDGQSRIANYYVAGLKELIDSCDIDGLYIDDTAIDRHTMRRVKQVFSGKKHHIDFHSWNHFDSRAGTVSGVLY